MTKVRWRLAGAWAVVIEAMILWPKPPDMPQAWNDIGFDKFVHTGVFGVQAALLSWAWLASGGSLVRVFATTAAFGALTEVQQYFIPTRSMELGDFLADATGAALGLAVFAIWARSRQEFSR